MKITALLAFLILGSVRLLAQQTGALWGNLRDEQSGDPITNATVTVKQSSDQFKSTRTDHRGDFRFYAMPEGTYVLNIDAEGYQPVIIEQIPIGKMQNLKLNLSFGKENMISEPLILNYGSLNKSEKTKKKARKNWRRHTKNPAGRS